MKQQSLPLALFLTTIKTYHRRQTHNTMDTRIFTDAEIKEFGENFNQRLHYDATTNTVSISLDKVSIRSPAQIDEGERVVRRFFAQHASKGKAHMIVNYEGFDCRLELQKKWGEVAIAFEKELYLSVRRLGQAAYPNPAMSKYTILVTGSTDGIGQETALQLAKQGHHVILHGRNAERLVAAAEFIKQEVGVGAKLDTVIGDLSSLTAVRAMVAEVSRLRVKNLSYHKIQMKELYNGRIKSRCGDNQVRLRVTAN